MAAAAVVAAVGDPQISQQLYNIKHDYRTAKEAAKVYTLYCNSIYLKLLPPRPLPRPSDPYDHNLANTKDTRGAHRRNRCRVVTAHS